jgi:hypothetical protein
MACGCSPPLLGHRAGGHKPRSLYGLARGADSRGPFFCTQVIWKKGASASAGYTDKA